MAHIMKCFKSGNTLRVTLNSGLRYALNAQPGDHICIDRNDNNGGLQIRNLTHEARTKKEKRK